MRAERVALVVVDVLNHYEHEDAEPLTASVRAALPAMRRVVEHAGEAGVLVVYVNDNHGDWGADRTRIADRAARGTAPDLVAPLHPPDDAAFLVKARHSAFAGTQLAHLLREREVDRVLLVGQVTEQCILYTALDAHVRGIPIAVARDAVAHIDADLAAAALRMMGENMGAGILGLDDVAALLDASPRTAAGEHVASPGR